MVARWSRSARGQESEEYLTARSAAARTQNARAAFLHLEQDVQCVGGQPVRESLSPLDGGGGPIVCLLDAEFRQFGRAADAVEIDVDEVDAPGMFVDPGKGPYLLPI